MKIYFPLICIVLCSYSLTAQKNDTLSNYIIETVKKTVEEFPQEKIYLHLDRPYYLAGDTIWLKAYHVAGSYHQPSPLSMTIQVELTNENKEIVQNILLKSDSGYAAGRLTLPDSIPAGNYHLRAFTPWMRNFSEEYFYHRNISVFNLALSNKKEDVKEGVDLQFFPESGNLLLNVKGKIGFKAIGTDGLGKKTKIEIFNDRDSLLSSTESNAMGMGSFSLLPEPGRKYFARLNGNKIYLPTPRNIGFTITATNPSDKPHVTVRLQSTKETNNKKNSVLICHTRGVINYVAKVDLTHNLTFVQIPKSNLLSGISTITLFNGIGQPVAERLIFIDQQDNLQISLTTDKKEYRAREKVTVDIHVTDQNKNPIQANLSLAVCDDLQAITGAGDPNIFSSFLLTSDLTGLVENPGYYFNSLNADRLESLDNLLLTQGWRRFLWQDILKNKWPTIKFPFDQGLQVKGVLKDQVTKKKVPGGKVTYLSSDPTADLQIATTNTLGEFSLYNLVYFDSTKAVLQGETKKGNKGVIFDIEKDDVAASLYPIAKLDKNKLEFERSLIQKGIERKKNDELFKFDEKAILLQGADISGKKIEDESTARVYGKGNSTIEAKDIPNQSFTHPLQLLQGRVAGVQVTGSGLSYSVTIRGIGSTSGNTPFIMVDNVQVDLNTLATVPPSMIESVEVFKGPEAAVFGSEGANGALLFYTKRGSDWRPPTLGIYNLSLSGYQAAKEFYSPRYDVKKPEHKKPDIRPTVFWQPTIITDANGKATITFYTNDNISTITGIIEGNSAFGKLAYGTFKYSVVNGSNE